MLDGQTTTLRERLRTETSANHARVDALFSTLDLTCGAALGKFLAAHRAGFAAMRAAGPLMTETIGHTLLTEMIDALDADLARLRYHVPELSTQPVGSDAIDHIVLGSRLGTAVLRRQWSAATDPEARAASRYFSLPGQGAAWRAHTERLTSMPSDGPDADAMIKETKSLYDLFERAFHGVA